MAMTTPVFAAGAVTLTPTSSTLAETQSTSVRVHLDAPLVGLGPGPAFFHLNLTASDPSRVSITPNPVDYASSDWFTDKNFTVTALNDGMHNASDNVTISFLVDSDSEHYNLYSGSFTLSITDINPAPVVQNINTQPTSTVIQTPKAVLADTGNTTELMNAISMIIFMTSLLIISTLNSLRQ